MVSERDPPHVWGSSSVHWFVCVLPGNMDDVNSPKVVEALKDVQIVDVSCGREDSHSLAADSEGASPEVALCALVRLAFECVCSCVCGVCVLVCVLVCVWCVCARVCVVCVCVCVLVCVHVVCVCVCVCYRHCIALPLTLLQAACGHGETTVVGSSAWDPTRTRARTHPHDWTNSMEYISLRSAAEATPQLP